MTPKSRDLSSDFSMSFVINQMTYSMHRNHNLNQLFPWIERLLVCV